MKKKILSLVLILVLISTMFILTGCGSDDEEIEEEMIETLNQMIEDMTEEDLNVFDAEAVQEYMEENTDYRLYALSGSEFEEIPEDSSSIEEIDVFPTSYVVIYDVNNDEYYSVRMGNNVEITDEATGSYTYTPEFKEATLLE